MSASNFSESLQADRCTVIEHDIAVPGSDGVRLMTDVYRIDNGEAHPCLLQRVPYSKSSPTIINGALDITRAVARGYTVVIQDCRGRYASDGEFEPFLNEAEDTEATLRWMLDQTWCNGSVGLFGRSYGALVQWLAAERDIPGLRAIAPMFSGADVERDWIAPHGVVERGFGLLWCIRHLAPDIVARRRRDGHESPLHVDELVALVSDFESLARNLDPHVVEQLADIIPLVRAFATDVANTRSFPPRSTHVPALVIGGWFDIFLDGTMRSYQRIVDDGVSENALIVGPWPHGGANGGVFPERDFGLQASSDAIALTDLQLDWFDRWCRPQLANVTDEMLPKIFLTGADVWRTLDAWPPPPTNVLSLYVNGSSLTTLQPEVADGGLTIPFDVNLPVPTLGGATFLPGLEVAANAGPRDQRSIVEREDVTFLVGEATEAMEVMGEVVLDLFVDADPGTRICARLVDVEPNGRLLLLCEGAGIVDDGSDPMRLSVGWIAHALRTSHRWGLLLMCTSFPRFSPYVVTGREDISTGVVTVRFGGEYPSCLRLPVVS